MSVSHRVVSGFRDTSTWRQRAGPRGECHTAALHWKGRFKVAPQESSFGVVLWHIDKTGTYLMPAQISHFATHLILCCAMTHTWTKSHVSTSASYLESEGWMLYSLNQRAQVVTTCARLETSVDYLEPNIGHDEERSTCEVRD